MNALDERWLAVRDRWPLRVKNSSGETIPPFSVVLVASVAAANNEMLFTVRKPNAASTDFNWNGYLVTGPFAIGSGSDDEGLASDLAVPGYARYDTGTPAPKEVWGARHGQFTLSKGYHGFECLGGLATACGNRVGVFRWIGVGEVLVKNETGSAIPASSSGTMNVYVGAAGSETDSGMDLSVYNRSSVNWANGKFGACAHIGNAVYGTPWQT